MKNVEKPKVPPKPSHLNSRRKVSSHHIACSNAIPKPPEKFIEDVAFEDFQRLSPNESSTELEDLQVSLASSLDITAEHLERKTLQPVLHIKEEPELTENGSIKDVRLRPLPLLPQEKLQQARSLPWFCAVDRKKAEKLVTANGENGAFIIRPSSKGENSLAVTLWNNGRPYNIPIRTRSDNRFALGTPKDMEQSFKTIEEMMMNYHVEELVLYSNGVETGRTILTPLLFSTTDSDG